MAMNITTKTTDLKSLFNSVKEVYFKKEELTASMFSTALTCDLELPVLEEGVSFNTGEVEVTTVKLTTGEIWSNKSKKGDPDISFNVASVQGAINDLLLNVVGTNTFSAEETVIDGITLEGKGYSLEPKKVKGSLIMPSDDRQTVVALPNVEIYSSLVVADGDNPAYFKLKVTPLKNSEGADIMILWKKKDVDDNPSGGAGEAGKQ